MIWLSETLKAIAEACKSLCDYLNKRKEKQIETTVLKDKESLKKASNVTEEIVYNVKEYLATDSQFTMWVAELFFETASKEQKKYFKKYYKMKLKIKKKLEKLQKEFEKYD